MFLRRWNQKSDLPALALPETGAFAGSCPGYAAARHLAGLLPAGRLYPLPELVALIVRPGKQGPDMVKLAAGRVLGQPQAVAPGGLLNAGIGRREVLTGFA